MRKIYLVKKNPELPADGNNWIVMSGHEFAMFMQTPEGKQRKNNFGQLDACTMDDVIIVAECGVDTAKRWRSEKDKQGHSKKLKDDKDGVSDAQIENLKEKIYRGTATRTDITRITRRLGDEIGKVYGWDFPKQSLSSVQRDAR